MARKRRVLAIFFRLIVCVILLAIGSGVYALLMMTKPQPGRTEEAMAVPRVRVLEARTVPVRREWEGFGTARALDSADVPARVTATVEEIPSAIVAGAWVEAGELLVQLDDSDFQSQFDIATQVIADLDAQEARITVETESWKERVDLAKQLVALAQAEFDRVTAAQQREVAKQREVDQAKQALIASIRDEVAAREEFEKLAPARTSINAQRLGQEAQRRLARQNIDRCRITSPLNGILQTVDVELGENLSSGERVARVVDLRTVEVPLKLPASARASLRAGDAVVLRATGGREQRWKTTIARLSPADDQGTRTMGVYVEIEQDPREPAFIAPGKFLRASVSSSVVEERWLVPRRSLSSERLLVVNDGRVASRPVIIDYQIEGRFPELGLPDEQWVILAEPLTPGALIVINATGTLPDGTRVEPYVATDEATAALPAEAEATP